MKTYDDYFRAVRHVMNDDPEPFTWIGIESTGLAEVMEEAEKHNYLHKLHCYEEMLDLKLPNGEQVEHHVRSMIFYKGQEVPDGE